MHLRYHRFERGSIKCAIPDTTQQTGYSCGPSALQAVCHYYGVGKEDEWEYIEDSKTSSSGADPDQLVMAARRYGLTVKECQPMTVAELQAALRRHRPVLLMIQAWGENKGNRGYRRSYKGKWGDGHWVVAIGFDRTGVLFEDPSLQAIRGFLSYDELEERWHDVGPRRTKIDHYGMILWKPGAKRSAYERRAERIA